MTILELYQWAKAHHYPYFTLQGRSILHGECAWLLFLSTATDEELSIVSARIMRHACRMAHEHQKENHYHASISEQSSNQRAVHQAPEGASPGR